MPDTHSGEVDTTTGDSRFFQRTGPHSLAAIVDAAQANAAPRMLKFTGIAPLQTARPDQVSFLDNRKYIAALEATQAGAVIVHPDMVDKVPGDAVRIVSDAPYLAWARVAALFYPHPPTAPGIHRLALVDETASVDPSAEIGPFAVIGARARIGPRCRIAAHAVIGASVEIGRDCRIGAHVSISHALLGDRVAIYPGVRIGQDGFGFAISAEGFVSVPQLGLVRIEDDVEIGANTTIDRGSMQDTVIGAGSRLDNLVMIGHNVRLGRACVIVAQAGISGSTVLGDQVMVGGQAGLTGHLTVGSGVRIGAQSGVMNDLAAGQEVVGAPARPSREFFRQYAVLQKMIRERMASGKPAAKA
jgi:UDP-3-O-[3-hydroxymyristoyl] glucosamine N-acyltransferase